MQPVSSSAIPQPAAIEQTAPCGTILLGCWLALAPCVSAQLRIVDYNTAGGPRPSLGTVLAAIGAESVNGIVKAPDVFTLQEQEDSASTTQAIVEVLNGIYGSGVYARATLDGATSGGGRPGMIYNTQSVQLIDQVSASTVSATGGARATLRYELRPVGYDSTADFYVYASHYKSSDDSTNAARRNVEAQEVRSNADALGPAHVIFGGDFNVYRSSEAMYQTLTASGEGQAFDPLGRPGTWHDNACSREYSWDRQPCICHQARHVPRSRKGDSSLGS